ncbi:MAG: hypothetical protein HQK51_11900 [Oligoflexia bacterium]|nr:hypothetical protein [Oligoflexia bacterium]
MKYLSIDIESTGLERNSYLIEFAAVPFDASTGKIENEQFSFHSYIQCPSFESIRPILDPWVIEHNKDLIICANKEGIPLPNFKKYLQHYLESEQIIKYFDNEKITLFGKSLNALDLPFLHRDLGYDFMNKYFSHKVMDLTSFAFGLIDLNILSKGLDSSSELMKYFNKGIVAHTATEDAINTIDIYLRLISKFKNQGSITSLT